MKLNTGISVYALMIMSAAAQVPAPKATPVKPAAAKPATSVAGVPKFKAIWEPVPFHKDIDLNAIACVGPETCWAVGDKSTIIHTTDGGKTWQVQLGGDPQATEDDLKRVFFLDSKHGWAMTDRAKILGTRDGSTWAELSTVSGTTKGFWFVSPQTGFEMESPGSPAIRLQRTGDGGKTWKPVSGCSVDTTVDGLPRKLACSYSAAQFLSPTSGFLGGGAVVNMGAYVAFFAKTSDGGQNWTASVIPESKGTITGIHFWSEKDGVVVLDRGEALYWTADAGGTWTRSVKQRLWPSYYGAAEGKIMVGAGEDSKQISYSFNGGRNFTTRPFPVPARVKAVTFFDAQNGYLVGDHAMVYRYRIVPIDYTSQGMIAAMAQ